MTEQKLTVGYIVDLKDVEWLKLSLESIDAIADEIVIIEDGHCPENLDILDAFIDGNSKYKVIHSKYAGNNGAQYNQILKHATGDWILVLDSDEVVNDNAHLLREYMNKEATACYSIRMEHCINTFVALDATRPAHYVPLRFYKRKEELFYQTVEHGTLTGYSEPEMGLIDDVIIWHYGKVKGMMEHKRKFEMNMSRSTIHNKEFLDWWYHTILYGNYPVRPIKDLNEHPSVIRREFYIK